MPVGKVIPKPAKVQDRLGEWAMCPKERRRCLAPRHKAKPARYSARHDVGKRRIAVALLDGASAKTKNLNMGRLKAGRLAPPAPN